MNDALRYRMLRQLVDYPDQMDADLDELIREAIENYRATAQPGAKPNEDRSSLGRSILARSGLECSGIEQELGSTAKAYMSRPETQGVGFALREIQDALRNELINQNPAVGKELKNLHEAFKRYLRVERAASYVGAEEGVYSPSQMMSAVKSVGGQRPFATGQAMLQPETQTALNVIGPRTPDSGTAGRLQTGSLLGAGLDVGAQVATTGAPLAASALMYNPLAQRLLTNIATKRPQMMGPIQPAISRGAAGFGGSLSGPPNQGALP